MSYCPFRFSLMFVVMFLSFTNTACFTQASPSQQSLALFALPAHTLTLQTSLGSVGAISLTVKNTEILSVKPLEGYDVTVIPLNSTEYGVILYATQPRTLGTGSLPAYFIPKDEAHFDPVIEINEVSDTQGNRMIPLDSELSFSVL